MAFGVTLRILAVSQVLWMVCLFSSSSIAQTSPPQKDIRTQRFEDPEVVKILGKCIQDFARLTEKYRAGRDFEGEREAKEKVGIPACEELWKLSQTRRDSVTELECLAGVLRIENEVSLILGQGGWIKDKVLERLHEQYLTHPRIALVVAILQKKSSDENGELLQGIMDRHADPATRAFAGWSYLRSGVLDEISSRYSVDRAVSIQVCNYLTEHIADLPSSSASTAETIKRARTKLESLDVGCAAMEIKGVSITGKPLKLSDLRGKWVLLKFFGPRTLPSEFEKLRTESLKLDPKDFAVLGVTSASTPVARRLLPQIDNWHGIGGEDGARTFEEWQVDGLVPRATYILDRQGIIQLVNPFRPISLEMDFLLSKERNKVKLLAGDLVATGATWQYWDDAKSPPDTWNQLDFTATSWKKGPSPLGYGINEVVTRIAPQKQFQTSPVCSWFRTEFNVKETSEKARYLLTVRADDAAVIWLNGVEVARSELLLAHADDQTPSQFSAETYGTVAAPKHYRIPRELIRSGRNVLAARLHQARWNGMDAFMDATLTSQFTTPDQVPNTDWDRQEWMQYLEQLEELTASERQALEQIAATREANEYVRYAAISALVAAGGRSGNLVNKVPTDFDDEQKDSLNHHLKQLLPNLAMQHWTITKREAFDLLPRAKAVIHLLPNDGDARFTQAVLQFRAGEFKLAKESLAACQKLQQQPKELATHALIVLINHGLGDKAATLDAHAVGMKYLQSRGEWEDHRYDRAFWREAMEVVGK